MLIATWIIAIGTAILAVSGPVALLAWLSARKQDRERRQRERDEEARERLLQEVKNKYVSRESVAAVSVLGGIVGVIGVLSWLDGKRPKS
jgi:hypothetical protein